MLHVLAHSVFKAQCVSSLNLRLRRATFPVLSGDEEPVAVATMLKSTVLTLASQDRQLLENTESHRFPQTS